MSCASSSSIKRKEKEIQKKKNIKSRKMLVSKAFHNTVLSKRHTLVLSNTRELDRVPTTD